VKCSKLEALYSIIEIINDSKLSTETMYESSYYYKVLAPNFNNFLKKIQNFDDHLEFDIYKQPYVL
jgi:hypothetical protein